MERHSRFSSLKRYVSLYIYAYTLSLLVSIFIDYISFNQELNGVAVFSYFVANSASFFLLTFINLFIVRFFNRKYKKRENIRRIVFELLAAIIAVNLVSQIINNIEVFGTFSAFLPLEYIIINSVENIIIITLLELVYAFIKNKEDNIRIQKLQIENEKFKYNQLKNQINPHFLFNSFNVLNEMLYIEKPEKSSEYVSSLSDFYRYVLANQEHETVLLKEELDFIEHYISILTIRYSHNLIVDISVIDSDLEKRVIPMTLQILIENTVKHNIISNEEQLKVNIESDGDFIIVSNKISLRMDKIDSTGIGLNNLIESYKLFSNKKVEIINDNSNFIVKVPLI